MAWLDWLIRFPCPICDKPSSGGMGCFCQSCSSKLQKLRYDPWWTEELEHNVKLYAWGVHQGSLRRALHRLKYDKKAQVADSLGDWMGKAWNQNQAQERAKAKRKRTYTVVPIPVHPSRQQERGFNQAELMGTAFCHASGLNHQPGLLKRIRQTQPQYRLSSRERRQNLKHAFQVAQTTVHPILLIDDIYTTGSTIAAAQEVLETAGMVVAGVVVAARAL